MPTDVSLYGTFELPFSIAFDATAGGAIERSTIGGVDVRVALPRLRWFGERPEVTSPHARTLPARMDASWSTDDPWKWGSISSWNQANRTVAEWWARGIALRADGLASKQFTYTDYLHGRGAPQGEVVKQLFDGIDQWARLIGEWIEVLTDQDAERESPLRNVWAKGEGLTLWTKEAGTSSLGATAHEITILSQDAELLNRRLWRQVLRRAGAGTPIPEEHRLLIDARAAIRRSQFRRAAIDAGTAAELALHRLLELRLARIRNPPRDQLINQRRTLGQLVKLLEPALPVSPADLGLLVEKRNQSVHRSQPPVRTEALAVVTAAQAIVGLVEPLPRR